MVGVGVLVRWLVLFIDVILMLWCISVGVSVLSVVLVSSLIWFFVMFRISVWLLICMMVRDECWVRG